MGATVYNRNGLGINIECLDNQSIYWTNRNTGKEQTDHILSKKLYIYRDEKARDVFLSSSLALANSVGQNILRP